MVLSWNESVAYFTEKKGFTFDVFHWEKGAHLLKLKLLPDTVLPPNCLPTGSVAGCWCDLFHRHERSVPPCLPCSGAASGGVF